MAQLCALIANLSGKFRRSIDVEFFLPDFLNEEEKVVHKSLEQQRAEFQAFKGKLQAMKVSVTRKPV